MFKYAYYVMLDELIIIGFHLQELLSYIASRGSITSNYCSKILPLQCGSIISKFVVLCSIALARGNEDCFSTRCRNSSCVAKFVEKGKRTRAPLAEL